MRILFVSNFYPPHFIGGYELGCRDIVESLKARGHDVCVLTSTYKVDGPRQEGHVYRWLVADEDFGHAAAPAPAEQGVAYVNGLIRAEAQNQAAMRDVCEAFRPDVVYLWNLTHTSISVAFLAEQRGLPTCYFISEGWLSQWENDRWYKFCTSAPRSTAGRAGRVVFGAQVRKRGVARIGRGLDLGNVHFASQYLKDFVLAAGKPVQNGRVIHWGVEVERYAPAPRPSATPPRRLLYVGQVAPFKGVHTLLEALNRIVRSPEHRDVRLTIAGGSVFPDYEAWVRLLVKLLSLEDWVHFTGKLPREEITALYGQHDVLLFPSVWPEPFGITPLEAMASGLAVVGTLTGGSPEIFVEGENALTFPAEDVPECARQIARLLEAPDLHERICRNGLRTVRERFTLEIMVDKIDAALSEAVSRSGRKDS